MNRRTPRLLWQLLRDRKRLTLGTFLVSVASFYGGYTAHEPPPTCPVFYHAGIGDSVLEPDR